MQELRTNLISIGTQIVTHVPIFNRSGKIAHPAGAVGVIVAWLDDGRYRVRFLDGYEENLSEVDLTVRKHFQMEGMKDAAASQTASLHLPCLVDGYPPHANGAGRSQSGAA